MKESKDILSLFEALNNHEIFTPPRVARQMLDLIPSEVWRDPQARLLDPCTKSGVFLREAFYRFYEGLSQSVVHIGHDGKPYDLSVPQQRINHILRNMLYGIATSELTAYVARRTLYGVMHANVDKQIAALDSFEESTNFKKWTDQEKSDFIGRNKFNEYYDHRLFNTDDHKGFEHEGNIFYPHDEIKLIVNESDDYAMEDKYFPFIDERTQHQKIIDIKGGNMKFDVIIGNPPYQLSDGGESSGASPIYNLFIDSAKRIKPKFISMIIPSRWFSGGKGLDSFRHSMISERDISHIVDYQDSSECFPSVEIKGGVCYFLWQNDYSGPCSFTQIHEGKSQVASRELNEYDILIRSNKGVIILDKVIKKHQGEWFSSIVSSRKPFGLPTNFKDTSNKGEIELYTNNGISRVSIDQLPVKSEWTNVPKIFLSKAYNGGEKFPHQIINKPIIPASSSACTETYLVIGADYFGSHEEAENCLSYMKTKLFRFMVWLRKISQDNPRDRFEYAPLLDFKKNWNDESLYALFCLSSDEIEFVEQTVKSME